jgi:hypothetical protein
VGRARERREKGGSAWRTVVRDGRVYKVRERGLSSKERDKGIKGNRDGEEK